MVILLGVTEEARRAAEALGWRVDPFLNPHYRRQGEVLMTRRRRPGEDFLDVMAEVARLQS